MGVIGYAIMAYSSYAFIARLSPPPMKEVQLKPNSSIVIHYVANGSTVKFYFTPKQGVKVVGISSLAGSHVNITGRILLPSHSGNIIINKTNKTVLISYALEYAPASCYNRFSSPNFVISTVIHVISLGLTFMLAGVLFISGVVLTIIGLIKRQ
ncbi:hypothetical protein [Acidianus sp. HS-5]|uniref:hypothetical protein n=1 Tax=Acidianus sp. HS-5 TaxID=2886040 RepID=UPI001F2A2C1B|nr:hypothetical protein [Acidianus sp. HS-5]BDC17484.1 hypothetical protein HS5_03740 [Acidianus sp. HS-5]